MIISSWLRPSYPDRSLWKFTFVYQTNLYSQHIITCFMLALDLFVNFPKLGFFWKLCHLLSCTPFLYSQPLVHHQSPPLPGHRPRHLNPTCRSYLSSNPAVVVVGDRERCGSRERKIGTCRSKQTGVRGHGEQWCFWLCHRPVGCRCLRRGF